MFERYIVVCDASRAEIFGLGHNVNKHMTWLVELALLDNPERRLRPSERFSATRPGVQRANKNGPVYGVNDGRDKHDRELDRRFAGEVAQRLRGLVGPEAHVVLTASPRMLALLTAELHKQVPGAHLESLAADLIRFPPARLHDYLAKRGLIPERGRAGLRA